MKYVTPFTCTHSPDIAEFLQKLNISIAISTYQTNRLIFLSAKDRDTLVQLNKIFEYELPPSFDNSSIDKNLSPIFNENYLNLKKGWSLISPPINDKGIGIKYDFNVYVHFDEYNSTDSYEFNSSILNSGWNLVGTGADINLDTNEFNNIWAFDNIDKTWINNPTIIKRGYEFWIKITPDSI